MTDKEKIRQEIERLQETTMDINHNFTSDYNQGLYDGLSQLELFIESLPEEKKPIREYVSPEDSTLGKLYKEAMEELEEKIALYEKNHKKSVSNGLEQAANDYVGHAPEIDEDLSVYSNREAFKAGAKWQKEQTIYKACNYLFSHMGLFVTYFDDDIVENIERSEFIKKFRIAMEE